MVAADRQRPHPGSVDAPVKRRDILDRSLEAVARAHRHVANVGGLALAARRHLQRMVIGADALDLAHRPRPEPRAGPVGDAEIHRHPDQRHLSPPKSGRSGASGRYGRSSRVEMPA